MTVDLATIDLDARTTPLSLVEGLQELARDITLSARLLRDRDWDDASDLLWFAADAAAAEERATVADALLDACECICELRGLEIVDRAFRWST